MFLENCGVDDEEFSAMLEGLAKNKDFERLFYKSNVFGEDSLESVHTLLKKGLTEQKTPPDTDDSEEEEDKSATKPSSR